MKFILTKTRQFVSICGINYVYESLQLKLPSRGILVMVEHRKFEGWLNFVGALLEDCTCNQKTYISITLVTLSTNHTINVNI